tara:strand:+ start:245 stop:391 length:147 start_codon:yes stop_codon:yes gene_type:complete
MFKSRERANFDISYEFEKIRQKLLLNKSFFFEVFLLVVTKKIYKGPLA